GSSIGVYDGLTISCRIPETPARPPLSMGTFEAEFKGDIQMLSQLVATQLGRQNPAPASFSSHGLGASKIIVFLRMNPPVFIGSK
ncbi:hypothetical protein HAX54_037454, partial [Datura stramonium]|nr:hypothetical protein [Datura stramonium]